MIRGAEMVEDFAKPGEMYWLREKALANAWKEEDIDPKRWTGILRDRIEAASGLETDMVLRCEPGLGLNAEFEDGIAILCLEGDADFGLKAGERTEAFALETGRMLVLRGQAWYGTTKRWRRLSTDFAALFFGREKAEAAARERSPLVRHVEEEGIASDAAYVGGRSSYKGIPLPRTWRNPYRIGRDGTREETIDKYRKRLWKGLRKDESRKLHRMLAELAGRELVCHCAPERCHAEVLVAASEWARKRLEDEAAFGEALAGKLAREEAA